MTKGALAILVHGGTENWPRQPARKTLGAKIPVGGLSDLGRHHGTRYARRERRENFAAAGLSRLGLEPRSKADRGHRMLSWCATRRVPAANRYFGLPAAADA